jgi:WD40 repeat protein
MTFQHKILTGHSSAVYAVIPGIESNRFYTGAGDGFVAEWNLETGSQEKFSAKLENPVFSILFLPLKKWLLAATSTGSIHCINLIEKKEIRHLALHRGPIYHMVYLPLQNQFVVAGGDGVLSTWSAESMELVRSIPVGDMKLRKIAVEQDGKRMAVACGDGTVRIFETDFLNETVTIPGHIGGAGCVAWHPDKKILVTGGKDGMIRCWHSGENFRKVLELPAHKTAVYTIAFSQGGEVCASCSLDKTIKTWESSTFEFIEKMDFANGGHQRSVNDLCWAAGKLITVSDDRRIIVWSISPGL